MAVKPKEVYKGRQKSHKLAKVITASVLALVVIAVALFFWLRQYVVYDENGNATLISPFAQQSDDLPSAE